MTTDPRTQHRPVDFDALHREALRLARCGLTPRDVGELLKIGTRAAAELLRPDFATTMPPPEVKGTSGASDHAGNRGRPVGVAPASPPTP